MEILLEQSSRLLAYTPMDFHRYLDEKINWKSRLVGIKGARGVGKTTLLLQHLKRLELATHQAAYFSLDDLYFAGITLRESGESFYKKGGRVLALDEVHKYPNWAMEVKNLYDFFPELQIIFTGSSIIDIAKEEGDLSRRALLYELSGLSYREYLAMKKIAFLPVISLEEQMKDPASVRSMLPDGFRPYEHFTDYLRYGYYPYGVEEPASLYQRINQVMRTIVEIDMAALPTFDIRNARKMFQLIEVVSREVPFKPNIRELAEKTGIHRNSMNAYLHYLEQAKIIALLHPAGSSTATLQKPEKIYLQNTTLLHALARGESMTGSVRETFVHAMLSASHTLTAPKKGDFLVDDKYTLEVGGSSKDGRQIRLLDNAWLVKDGLEYGSKGVLPLWAMGIVY
jgi:predicted AAA+ superfamily ATPase